MDNTLPNSTEVAFDDIEQLEELYHSIVEPNLPKSIGEEGQESLDLSEESQMKTVLGLIVQKCFEKIKGYRFMLEQQKKSVDDVQLSFDDIQEENAYLKGTQNDLLSKIEKLKLHVDEIEEMNESLHNEISELKLAKMRIELLGTKAKPAELDSPQLNVQNLSSSEIVKPLQEEMRSQELEIERLRETMLVQEQLLEKLQTEVDRYHSIESKYDQLKGELNSVGQPSDMSKKNNTKLSILAERINNIRSSLNSGGQKGSPGRDEDADESYNRNFVITQNLKLRAELNRSQKRHKSLVEDVISTRMSEQPKESSTPNLNSKDSLRTTFLLDKNSLLSLKEKKEKLRYAVDSDLDGQNSESAKSDKVELEIEPLKKEKVLLTWLEGDISNSDSKSEVSSSSIKFKKSKKELPKSKFMREEELDTTVGATERMGFKSSIDSYLEKKEEVNSYEIRELEKETIEKETTIENVQKNDNLEICKPKQSIDEYLRNEKKKAKANTQFSIFNLIIAVVFRSRA